MLECSCEILMPSSFRTRRPHVLATLAFLAIFVQALSISTRAEVHVAGGSDAITVEAKEASVEELLTALKKSYGLQYGSSAKLSRSVSGTFAGSLQQVVSRVLSLQGYNFIAETSAQGTIVAVYEISTAPVSTVDVAPKAASVAPKAAPAVPTTSAQNQDRSRDAAQVRHAMMRRLRHM